MPPASPTPTPAGALPDGSYSLTLRARFAMLSAPVVSGCHVYSVERDYGQPARLLARDLDARLLWETQLEVGMWRLLVTPTRIAGFTDDQRLVFFERATGALQRSVVTGDTRVAQACVGEAVFYAVQTPVYYIQSYWVVEGDADPRRLEDGETASGMETSGQTVVVRPVGDPNKRTTFALDARGALAWRMRGHALGLGQDALLICDGRKKELALVDAASGVERWRISRVLPDHLGWSTSSEKGVVLVTNEKRKSGDRAAITCLEPATGDVRWTVDLLNHGKQCPANGPILCGDHVFVAELDGRWTALSLATGQRVYRSEPVFETTGRGRYPLTVFRYEGRTLLFAHVAGRAAPESEAQLLEWGPTAG